MLEIGLFLAFLIFVLHYYLEDKFSKNKLPPGPLGIPIFGTIFFLGNRPFVTFQNWAKKYGPLIRTKFGTTEVLVIDDPKILRQAFSKLVFNGRMNNIINAFHAQEDGRGMIFADGEHWLEQRRFAIRALREFGFGKTSMEVMIMDEVNDFIKWIKANEGKPINVSHRFILATANSMWRLLTGERHEQDDPRMTNLITNANNAFFEIQSGRTNPLFYYQKLIEILPNCLLGSWHRLRDSIAEFRKPISETIEYHQKSYDENNSRDYIDLFLSQIKKTVDPKSSFYGEKAYTTMKYTVSDLYAAGSGATSSTLSWSTIYLINFPNVLKKFQKELDNVIGKDGTITLSDRPKLPYTEALINEILRFSSLVSLGLMMNKTSEDTMLEGYFIKKGTQVIGNFYSCHFNEKIWGDPFNFRPERFLSSDGLTVIKNDNLMAFNVGKRECVAESLARDDLFLFLTNIFHKFSVFQDGKNLPSMEPANGIFREYQKFTAIFKERNVYY